MKNRFTLSLLLVAALACNQRATTSGDAATTSVASGESVQAAAAHDMTPEQLGELGAQIKKQPDQAKQLLGQHGLDEKSFEAKIRKVTEDPDASKRYAAAYQKANG